MLMMQPIRGKILLLWHAAGLASFCRAPGVSPGAEAAYVRGKELFAQAVGDGGGQAQQLLNEARDQLLTATQLAPDIWQHHNALGEVYLRQQRWEAAAQEFLTTTQLNNKVASAFLKLGLVRSRNNSYALVSPRGLYARTSPPTHAHIQFTHFTFQALEKLPQHAEKATEAKLIAARLNTDYADLDERTGESLAPARITLLRASADPASDLPSTLVEMPPASPGLAVIIPYRHRDQHLRALLPRLTAALYSAPDLKRGKFRIFVVEQANEKRWNKGMVYNAGFDYIHKRWGYECICFHDVDFLPPSLEGGGAAIPHYGCVRQPTHLSSAPSQYGYKVPYSAFFGGVLQMSARDFLAVNGYSNRFWGWGKEDDDLYMRFVASTPTPQISHLQSYTYVYD